MSDTGWTIRYCNTGPKYAKALEHNGETVLHLLTGTERNESDGGAERVLAALNENVCLRNRITALRQHARTACRAAHDKKAQLKHVKRAQYAAKKRVAELQAIVDKLPKDEDGDVLLPNTRYFWTKHGITFEGFYTVHQTAPPPKHLSEVRCWAPTGMHKTREAAEAARKDTP